MEAASKVVTKKSKSFQPPSHAYLPTSFLSNDFVTYKIPTACENAEMRTNLMTA